VSGPGIIERMRIERQPGESMATAYLWLTPEEAKELMDTPGQLLRDGDCDAHHHISSTDFQTEVTVMLDRA
jgi:hypothetical protein